MLYRYEPLVLQPRKPIVTISLIRSSSLCREDPKEQRSRSGYVSNLIEGENALPSHNELMTTRVFLARLTARN
jgi:hypothetical protein